MPIIFVPLANMGAFSLTGRFCYGLTIPFHHLECPHREKSPLQCELGFRNNLHESRVKPLSLLKIEALIFLYIFKYFFCGLEMCQCVCNILHRFIRLGTYPKLKLIIFLSMSQSFSNQEL